MSTFNTSSTSSSSPSLSSQVNQNQFKFEESLRHCRFDNKSHIRIQDPIDREHCEILKNECETFKNALDDFDSLYRHIQNQMEEMNTVMGQDRLIALGMHNILEIDQHQGDEKRHENE